jgi:hypothetical protein
MAGAWTLALTPHASGSSAPIAGVTLGVTFAQKGMLLTAIVNTVNNQSTTCLAAVGAPSTIALSGTVGPVPTGDVPPGNLQLTLAFTPAGATGDQTIALGGGIDKTAQTSKGLYSFAGAGTDCLEGFYTLTRAN